MNSKSKNIYALQKKLENPVSSSSSISSQIQLASQSVSSEYIKLFLEKKNGNIVNDSK
jgi:hypothetical protein